MIDRGGMAIIIENGLSDISSNPGSDCLHFTYHLYP